MGEEGGREDRVTSEPTAAISARLKRGEPLANRILRVDHGGENGAVNIYKAQALICTWRAPALVEELRAFRRHEERHRALFGSELDKRGVRQGIGYRLCGLGGFVLGFVTGILGRSAIAATTAAVERVVLRHLQQQLVYLQSVDPKAFSTVSAIVEEEKVHHDLALGNVRPGDFWPTIIDPIVVTATECVIWVGMHR
jgi:3-demethoxyubiquinol 3-hydroxylase